MVNGPFGILGAVPLGTSLGSAQFDCGGRQEVTVDSERRILGPGDAYYFKAAARIVSAASAQNRAN
jgi:hypothetical protein